MKFSIEQFDSELLIGSRPRSGEWLESELKSWQVQGIQTVVSCLTTKESLQFQLAPLGVLTSNLGIGFETMPLDPDPSNLVPELIIKYSYELSSVLRKSGTKLFVFCSNGTERSVLLGVSSLGVLGISVEDSLKYFEELKGYPCVEEEEHLQFLKDWEDHRQAYAHLEIDK